ncbi:MAG: hypothetical protein ACRDD7_01165, partial [Peptostreptococcaceae bacterium]
MTNRKIHFKLKNINQKENTIDISLRIDSLYYVNEIRLYKGNVKIINIDSLENVKEEDKEIIISDVNKNIDINYTVQIANLGKHGQNGEINENLITFTGGQVFLLPTNVLRGNDLELSKFVKEINVDYCEELNNKEFIIPYKEVIDKKIISSIKDPKWHDIYELMKSCYAFAKFENIQSDEEQNIDILIEKSKQNIDNKNTYYTKEIIEGINSLCNYYENLFDYKIKDLKIILLNKNQNNNEYILGGAGRNIIGATFDIDNLRDWQLLSHRLFHAYMDSAITIRQMHIAPQLWITEGLATYHENLALEFLDDKLKNKLDIDFDKEIKKIYRRYLYLRIKDINRLAISPIEEGKINSHGKIEFLHYTQAPLLIKMIEDFSRELNEKDSIIKYLKNINEDTFNIKSMFDYVLKNYCEEFAYKYLFNSSLIQLWNLDSCDVSEDIVINELNEYEELLWSWFIMEDEL